MNITRTITQYSFNVDEIFTVNIGLIIRADGSMRKRTHTQITNNTIRGAYKNQWRKDNPELNRTQRSRAKAKRRGWGSPIPINEYFDESHLHHLHIGNNHRIAMYIPSELHSAISHCWHDEDTMSEINTAAMMWYYFTT